MQRQPLRVSEVTAVIRGALISEPALAAVRVEGEVSNVRTPTSGHVYFTLKDDRASLRCVFFRSAVRRGQWAPENGVVAIATGRIDVYDADGSYQLYVDSLDPSAAGDFARILRERIARLTSEGIIDPNRKRPLPKYPRRVAVVTSPTGAALRDVLAVLAGRAPEIAVTIIPTPVQGEGVARAIAWGIRRAAQIPDVDAILLVRGGGSSDDLLAFSDERLARVIAASPIPIVSGVGHEIDISIADLVADHRAATPSAAAMMVSPDRTAVSRELNRRQHQVGRLFQAMVSRNRRELEHRRLRLRAGSPSNRVRNQRQLLDDKLERLHRAMQGGLTRNSEILGARRHRLDGLSYAATLRRGFSLTVTAEGRPVLSTCGVVVGQALRTIVADGEIGSVVSATRFDLGTDVR